MLEHDTSDAASPETFNVMKDLKSFKQKYVPESKIVLFTPVIRVDKGNANDINKKYIDLLKGAKEDSIFNDSIKYY